MPPELSSALLRAASDRLLRAASDRRRPSHPWVKAERGRDTRGHEHGETSRMAGRLKHREGVIPDEVNVRLSPIAAECGKPYPRSERHQTGPSKGPRSIGDFVREQVPRMLALARTHDHRSAAARGIGQTVYPNYPNGEGWQWVVTRRNKAATVTGGLRSSSSWQQGLSIRPDRLVSSVLFRHHHGQLHPEHQQTSHVAPIGGRIKGGIPGTYGPGYPLSRVCRDLWGLPDPCGYWTDKH